MMAKKITNIFNSKSVFKDNDYIAYKRSIEQSKGKSATEKWKIHKIAQDNQLLLKRLYEAQTSYNNKKYIQDYNKSLYYKNNICEYPPINSLKKKPIDIYVNKDNTFNKLIKTSRYSNNNNNSLLEKSIYNNNNIDRASKTQVDFKTSINNTNYNRTFYKTSSEEKPVLLDNQILLFYKSAFFQDLFYCKFIFFIENKKIAISIGPKDKLNTRYFIIIEGCEQVMKMKEYYKKYEDIIENLDHSIKNDLIYIKKNEGLLNYISIYIDDISILTLTIESILESYEKGIIKGERIGYNKTNNIYNNSSLVKNDEEDKKKQFEDEINSVDKENLHINNLVSDDEIK